MNIKDLPKVGAPHLAGVHSESGNAPVCAKILKRRYECAHARSSNPKQDVMGKLG